MTENIFDSRRHRRLFYWVLAIVLSSAIAQAGPPAMTTVTDVVYRADGTPAAGTLIISWPAFSTADGKAVASGNLTVPIGAGGAVSLGLAPNSGAIPSGTYYKVVYQLSDDTSSTEYWTVPLTSPTTISAIRAVIVPANVPATQVSREYVDAQLALKANDASVIHLTGNESVANVKTFSASPSVPAPINPSDVSSKGYADAIDSNAVHKTGAETIAGVKTFSASPSLPTPVNPSDAAIKSYADAIDSNAVHKTGTETIAGVKTFSASPSLPTPVNPADAASKGYADSLTDGVRYADRFANIQAAITAVGTSGSVMIPAIYFATDGFTNPNNILVQDQRKPNYSGAWNIRQWGAKGDCVTDDTTAIQAALSYFGKGGAGATQMSQLYFPASCGYKISNMLTFEGTSGVGIRLVGEAGWSLGQGQGSQIQWYGAQGGTMLLMLGANNSSIENLDFIATSGGNSSAASNLVWWDASNTVTQVAYNISAITRSGNIVTATTSAAHAFTAGRIAKVAGSTGGATSFNGTFQVLYTNDNTHVSWIQLGPNESGNAAGTVTNYQSSGSNSIGMRRVQFSNPKAIVTNISTVSGTNPITVTTSATHYLHLGDTAIIRSVSDTTYNGVWQVSTIPSSTTATLIPMPGVGQAQADNGAESGGTIQTDSSALRFAHPDGATPQISSFAGYDLFLQGDQLGTSVSAIRADAGGNTKDFVFYNGNVNGYRYGINNLSSGNLDVDGWTSALVTPDSTPILAAIDFLALQGQVYIKGVEAESTNYRMLATSAGPNSLNAHLDTDSYQSTPPTDDVVIAASGTLAITNSFFKNGRAAGSVPKIQFGSPLFGQNTGSLISIGNFYTNTAPGSAGPNPGYLPVVDAGGNTAYLAAGYYGNKAVNITSIGDMGSIDNTNNTRYSLNNVTPMAAIIDSGPGGSTGVAATGFIRGASTSQWCRRNNANSADICELKNSSDQDDLTQYAAVKANSIIGVTSPVTPNAAGGTTLGSAALPFSSAYIGGAATNNAQITGTMTAARVFTLPDTANDTFTMNAAAQTLTNKTYDTGGAGNVFKIGGTQISAVTGTGSAVLANSPSISGGTLSGTFAGSPTFSGTLTATGVADLSGSSQSLPVHANTIAATPATCTANKEMYLKTDAAAGQQLFICNSTGNGWNPAAPNNFKIENINSTPVSVSNTTTETTLMSFTLPANELAAGQVLHLRASGIFSTASSGAENLTFKVKADSTVLGSLLQAQVASLTNQGWTVDINVICVTAGSGGTVEGQGTVIASTVAGLMANSATIALSTTVSHTISVTATMSVANAGNSVSQRQMVAERLN